MFMETKGFITTRNEVGARLCFYMCLWFCSQRGSQSLSQSGLCPGGSLSRGCLSRGVSVQGVSVWGSLSRGSLSRGVSVQGSLCPGGPYPGGLCPGGLCPGGSLSGGSLSGGLCHGDPLYGNERVVHILLECILVYINKFLFCILKHTLNHMWFPQSYVSFHETNKLH